MAKVLSLKQMQEIRPILPDVVLAGGVFDLLHIGHINHLKDAKAAGTTLIVHVTSDKRVKEKKGNARPFQPQQERAEIIAALDSVDYVFIADVPHYNKLIVDALNPDVIFFNQEAFSETVKSYIKDINWLPRVVVSQRPKKHHTSRIIQLIQALPDPSQ